MDVGGSRDTRGGREPGRPPGGGNEELRSLAPRPVTRCAIWQRKVRIPRAVRCVHPRVRPGAGSQGAPARSPPRLPLPAGHVRGGVVGGGGGARSPLPGLPRPPPRRARSTPGFCLTSLCLEFAATSLAARRQFHGLWARHGARDRKPSGARQGLAAGRGACQGR